MQFSIAMLNELPEGRFYCSYNMLQIVRWVEVTIVKSTYNYGARIVKFLMFMKCGLHITSSHGYGNC